MTTKKSKSTSLSEDETEHAIIQHQDEPDDGLPLISEADEIAPLIQEDEE